MTDKNTIQKPKQKIDPVQAAIVGAVMVALLAVVVAQKLSSNVAGSQKLTVLIIGLGIVIGAIGGVVIHKKRN
jgi:hypothetical protein